MRYSDWNYVFFCPQRPCKWTPVQMCLPCSKTCFHLHLFLLSSDLCLHFFPLRDSWQDLQSVQWVHEWKGTADCLQHADGGLSLDAVPCSAPLQLSLREVRRLCLEEWRWAGAQVWAYESEWRGKLFPLPFDFPEPCSPSAENGLFQIDNGGSHLSHVRAKDEKWTRRKKESWHFSFLDSWNVR